MALLTQSVFVSIPNFWLSIVLILFLSVGLPGLAFYGIGRLLRPYDGERSALRG